MIEEGEGHISSRHKCRKAIWKPCCDILPRTRTLGQDLLWALLAITCVSAGGSQCPETSLVLVPAPVFPFASGCCFSRSGMSIGHRELGQRQDEVAFTSGSEICFFQRLPCFLFVCFYYCCYYYYYYFIF